MDTKPQIKNGLIGIVHQKTFMAYAEQFFLWIYGLPKNYSFKNRYWNCKSIKPHVFSIVEKEVNGEKKLCYAEAIAKGFKIEPWPGRYVGREDSVSWIDWKPGSCNITEYEKATLDMYKKNIPYDFMTIVYLAIYSPFGIWLGPRNREKGIKRVICGEAIAYNINEGKRKCGETILIEKPWMAQPWDFYYLGKKKPRKSIWRALLIYIICYTIGFPVLIMMCIIYALVMVLRKLTRK